MHDLEKLLQSATPRQIALCTRSRHTWWRWRHFKSKPPLAVVNLLRILTTGTLPARSCNSIDLDIGGPSWSGCYFGTWGRATEWRLHLPNGAHLTAGELYRAPQVALDVDYLQQRLEELELYADPAAVHFGPRDAQALIEVARLILKAARHLPIERRRPRFERS